jgi:ligand-binding sensor domain-containing protein
MHCVVCLFSLLAIADAPFPDWRSEMLGDRTLPASVGQRLSADELGKIARDQPPTPYAELTAGIRAPDGTLWVASPRGLMQLAPGRSPWRLFHSRRWLPDDRVLDLALAADGSVWVRTPAGAGRLFARSTTLDAKMAEIHAALRKYHVWKG